MEKIARDFLLPDVATGRPRCDSRTLPEDYFKDFENSPAGKPQRKQRKNATRKTEILDKVNPTETTNQAEEQRNRIVDQDKGEEKPLVIRNPVVLEGKKLPYFLNI